MSFNDDEPIVASQDVSGGKLAAFLAGKTKATIINKTTAPLEESKFKVMLELTGAGSGNDRSGVDLVTVLDKLGPIDRLSIVTFNEGSQRLCPLRQITENSQGEIENLVNSLVANGGTNISAAGVKLALCLCPAVSKTKVVMLPKFRSATCPYTHTVLAQTTIRWCSMPSQTTAWEERSQMFETRTT
ncbi:hypothetical protein CsSME_00052999 [Camellia sinensis var. sinensis]